MALQKCKNCGELLAPDAIYCGKCGMLRREPFSPADFSAETVPQKPSGIINTPQPGNSYLKVPAPKNNKNTYSPWIVYSIIAIIIIAVVTTIVIIYSNYIYSPAYELQQYCNALKGNPDFDTAYAQLSERDTFQSTISEDDFIAQVRAEIDPQHGIGDCSVKINDQIGDIAHGTITYTYGNGSQSTKQYELFHYNGTWFRQEGWKIESSTWQGSRQHRISHQFVLA